MGSPTPVAVVAVDETPARKQLNLWDATSIIVGIIIGSGFYATCASVAAAAASPRVTMAVWVIGGVLSLIGALCYAELATTYPKDGGDYVFLTRAFGRHVGFQFAWSGFWIVRPGNVAAMAFVFAEYARQLLSLGRHDFLIYAAGAVAVLAVMNILGFRSGKWTQNLLTAAKVLGLVAVFAVGLLAPTPTPPAVAAGAAAAAPRVPDLNYAMIMVFFAYGGWNDVSYVAAEVRDPRRNILRALVAGTAIVTLIYLAGNLAFLKARGYEGFASSQAVAADVMAIRFGDAGRRFISALICVSCLGAINGMILTGARIYYAAGQDHRPFAWLGRWHERLGIPLRSMVIQSAVTLLMAVGFGAYQELVGHKALDQLIVFTSPVFWGFFLLSAISIFVLRRVDRDVPRGYRVPGYPLTPALFCAGTAFMVYASVRWAALNVSWALWAALGVLLAGLAASFLSSRPSDSMKNP
jgi:basic amino acid/polyamine antiporter, APA family